MKTNLFCSLVATLALTDGLLLCDSAKAQVVGINTPGSSYSSILFNDTTSFERGQFFLGTTSINQNISPWGGAATINNTLALTTDPVTSDFAQGNITADVIAGNYSIALNNVVLNQAPNNGGFADLIFQFSVEFQLDPILGLPSQATVFPNFSVNGTVPYFGNFASVNGYINYYGVNVAGPSLLLDTVNYNSLFNTTGSFSSTVNGTPVNGITPNLLANSTLTLVGYIDFKVDPASINAETLPVPEPGSGLLLGLAAVSGLLWRKGKGVIKGSLLS